MSCELDLGLPMRRVTLPGLAVSLVTVHLRAVLFAESVSVVPELFALFAGAAACAVTAPTPPSVAPTATSASRRRRCIPIAIPPSSWSGGAKHREHEDSVRERPGLRRPGSRSPSGGVRPRRGNPRAG